MSDPNMKRFLEVVRSGRNLVLSEFLDWLDSQGYVIAEEGEAEGFDHLVITPLSISYQQLLANFFGVDLNELEKTRRAMLDELQKNQENPDDLQP